MQILLIGVSLRPQVEVHVARGGSDLEVEAGDCCWVFELKFSKAGEDSKGLCRKAVEQIRAKDHGNTIHARKLVRVDMVFDEASSRIATWQVVE